MFEVIQLLFLGKSMQIKEKKLMTPNVKNKQ